MSNMSKFFKSEASMGSGLIVLSSLFYASYGVWTALMGDFFSGYTASAIRSVLVLMILLPLAIYLRKIEPLQLKKYWPRILAMTLISTLIWGLLYYAVLNAGVGVSATVNYAAITIGMVLFGSLLARERFTKQKGGSLAIGILGLLLIFVQSYAGNLQFLPLIAAMISGLAVAANTVVAKQLPYNAIQTTVVLWFTSVLANVPMIFVLNEPTPEWGYYIEWLYLILFAVFSILATWTLMSGLKFIDAGLAGILGLLEIVFGIIFGILFFGEVLQPLVALGAMLILIAAAYPSLMNMRRGSGA